MKNVVLVSNMWSEVSLPVGERREKQLSSGFLKPDLDKGAQMARHYNTVQSAHDIIRRITRNAPVVLQIQRELVDEHKDIATTGAGESISKKLSRKIGEHRTGLENIRGEMERTVKRKGGETVLELQEKRRVLEEQIEKIAKDEEGMVANYAAEKEKMEATMTEMEQKRERDEVGHRRHSDDPTRRLQDRANVYVADRARLVKRPQNLVGMPGVTSPGELTRRVTPPRTRETEWANPPDRTLPQSPLRTPNAQVPSRLTSYVRASFRLAAHGS